jgi:hypothetical protein
MSGHARRTGPAVEAHYRFLEWLIPGVEKFPRTQKFLLGDRIKQTALNILEDLIEATYTRQRRAACPPPSLSQCLTLPPFLSRLNPPSPA